jgi:hypothetical protein
MANTNNSWGYHGDDGSCCESVNGQYVKMEGYDPGDTVGCAIDFTKGTLFFTKNGHRKSKFYPCLLTSLY